MIGGAGFHLDTGDGHRLWVDPFGDPGGAPILFLHGGPGSGCNPSQRALFDPARHRVVFLDQRGAGRSLPARSRADNTTAHLLADIERVRAHFGIGRWLVVGGSWGATLALAYAQAHSARVTGLVLRAVFLGTRGELNRAFLTMLPAFHPALYEALLAVLPPMEREDPLPALWRRILDADPAIHAPAALAWYAAERAMSELIPDLSPPRAGSPLPATPFMEAHYFLNDCFLAPNALLAGADRLTGMPGVIVQARYDLLCPPAGAHALAARWPDARIAMVESAGHSLAHPGVAEAVIKAVHALTPTGADLHP